MLRAAAADHNPTIIIEARSFYQTKGMVDLSRSDEQVGGARIARHGSTATIVTYGTALPICLEAANRVVDEGHDVQIVDLRWLNPVDWSFVIDAVAKTKGKAIIAHEANLTGGFGAEIATRLWEHGAKQIVRLGAADTRIPAAPNLQKEVLPTVDDVIGAIGDTA